MAWFDMPAEQLRAYAPALSVPEDFSDFWRQTLAEARKHELAATFTAVDTGLTVIDTYDVTFAGYGGAPIRGWLHLPAGGAGPLPAVVEYIGYGGGRGLAHERNLWAQAGYAHFIMDTRGQGAAWSVGATDDPEPVAGAPSIPGFMTRGIMDPATYYYRRVFTDAVRAVEAVRVHPAVDGARVAIAGGSQGGGITLAVSGLVDDLVAAMPDVPFLCDFPRSTTIVDTFPYGEIKAYLKSHRDRVEQVYRTLSYFDAVTLCRTATAPALFSTGLMDEVCPPSTVYAAFNAYGAPDKDIIEYAFNEHEGGAGHHDLAKLRWLGTLLAKSEAKPL